MTEITALKDVARHVASDGGATIIDVENKLKSAFAFIADEVSAGRDVRIHGFGTFKLKERPERKGRNPSSGEEITIAASKVMVFKATKFGK